MEFFRIYHPFSNVLKGSRDKCVIPSVAAMKMHISDVLLQEIQLTKGPSCPALKANTHEEATLYH